MITFRKPEMSDLAVMFAWQQHPETRMTSPKHQYPSWEKFMVTARGYVEDLDEMFQLMCVDGHPVGFIVFQQAEHGIWFGTRVAPGLHERGFEVTLVEHAKQRFGSKLRRRSDRSGSKKDSRTRASARCSFGSGTGSSTG